MEEKFMNGEKAIEVIRELSKSQGFYGRILQNIENFTEEQKEEFNNMIKNAEIENEIDLILFLEC